MLYGVGSMLGAGIYGLIGKAAGVMGSALWAAFLLAMLAALLTGLSYASIASRYPKAAGAAYVTLRAYRWPSLAYVVGLTVLLSGLVSIATQAKVVAENVAPLLGVAEGPSIAGTPLIILLLAIGFLLLLAAIVFRGITESLWANALCTFLEAGGLLLVIIVGITFWGDTNLIETPTRADGTSGITAILLLQGSLLTFFSFIGFEDMLNVAEEVENPQRSIPFALIGAMLIASAIYVAVSITAVSVLPWQELVDAPSPLQAVVARAAPWFPEIGFTFITIAAVANTALVNYVMGSRMLYGMSRQGMLPEALGSVHGRRRTPHVAIALMLAVVIALQFAGDITQLASATVLLLLLVFTVVNIGLAILKRRDGRIEGSFDVPLAVPVLGALVCLCMMAGQATQEDMMGPLIALGLVATIGLLYIVSGKRNAELVEATS
ncbi:APC family permease [Sphingomonas crocodyli]|uniref:Amino acid permease n=1 Tax=Sphingomonas crocodyli TaxID=1979270 RepID=A0A437M5U1_9SPHN|nr:APC family permease [Sphingomonas crocodyli]RVT93009.1 amino acid permease [Sphingomonas crocodyli]